MAIETDLNVSPYYDDFDENKNFHRVLFKPAVPLQAREITQLQTILQNQIERFGQFQFKEGSIIKGCSFSFDDSVRYAKVNDKTAAGTDVNVGLFSEGDYIRNQANVIARIVDKASGLETQNPDLNTLFFHYINTGTGAEKEFASKDEVEIYPAVSTVANVEIVSQSGAFTNADTVAITSLLNGSGATADLITVASGTTIDHINVTSNGAAYSIDDLPTATVTAADSGASVTLKVNLHKTGNVTISDNDQFKDAGGNTEFNVLGKAFQMKVTDGVIFQKGTFQRFAEQDIIVSKYTNRPNEKVVGVQTVESIVNNSIDTSLLDNAAGFANENAPGADRLKLTPALVVNTKANAESSNNFLKFIEFQFGNPIQMQQGPVFSSLGQELAKRTYEESGDYVVENFSISTENKVANTTHLSAVVGAGIGYVKGQRFELSSATRLPLERAKTTSTITDQEISLNYGNYVRVNELLGQFGHETNDMVVLLDGAMNAVTSGNNAIGGATVNNTSVTFNGGSANNVVGTARVKSIESIDQVPGKSDSEYHLYLFNIKMNSGKSFKKDVKSLWHYSGTEYSLGNAETNKSASGVADVILEGAQNEAFIKERDKQTMVFPIGATGVSTVDSNPSYVYKGVEADQFSTGGVATFSLSDDLNFTYGTSDTTLSETQERDLIIIPKQNINAASRTAEGNANVASSSKLVTNCATTDLKSGDQVFINTTLRTIDNIVNSTAFNVKSNVGLTSATANVLMTFQNNRPISISERTSANATITSSGQTLTINLGRNLSGTMNADIIHNIKDPTVTAKTKTVNITEVGLTTDTNSGGLTGPWCLGVPDAFELLAVYVCGAGTDSTAYAFNSGAFTTERTDKFEILSGMNDSYYGLSKLRIKPNSGFSLSAGQNIAVRVRNFAESGDGFFTFQSYNGIIDDANTANTTAITTQEIPVYTSQRTGREHKLRDSIDFRPRVQATANSGGTFTSGDATSDPSQTAVINQNSKVAKVNSTWIGDVSHYLPRKDRIVVEGGQLHIVKGIPSINPQLPAKPGDAMQLGTVDVPVFPSLDAATARYYKRPDLAAKIRTTQLKRYTMSDIKSIDTRVQNLEYYTSLNLLEKQTSDSVLPGRTDPLTNRFKNGFLVDNFASLTVGNPLNDEFKAGFDKARQLLTSRFEQYNIGLKFDTGTNISRVNDAVYTSMKDRPVINQNKATQDRRCTSAFWQYNGNVQLFPDYFSGTDVKKAPENAMQIDIDVASGTLALIDELNKILPAQQPSDEVIDESTETRLVDSDTSDGTRTDTFETVTQQTVRRTTTQLTGQARTTTKKVGEFVTDITFQPYIPGMDIRFVATGLRPGLQHYVYFDDVAMSAQVAPATVFNPFDSNEPLDIISSSRARRMMRRSGAFNSTLTANSSGGIAGIFRIPANKFFVGERKFVIADISNLSQVKDTVSSASARFNAYNFGVEKADVTTSTRSPLISSAQSSRIFNTVSVSNTEVTTNVAIGDVTGGNTDPVVDDDDDTRVGEVANTVSPPPDDTDPVTPPRPKNDLPCVDTWEPRPWGWGEGFRGGSNLERREINGGLCGRSGDPLAQTFLLQPNMFRGSKIGYLTSMDLFFSQKDPRLGTIVEIRETVNGAPGPKVLPFSRVRLASSQVNTSTDATTATRINFKAPVPVDTGKEYCFVILPEGNSPEYKVWTAKAGQKDISNQIPVNQDWGQGTMFLSTNNRTWTEYVDEDAKFIVNAAYFDQTKSSVDLVNEDYEFIEANTTSGINGAFASGEEVFKLGANITGTAVFSAGNSTITGTGTSFTAITGLGAGSKIVLQNSNNQFDVVEVAGISSDTVLTLRGAPDITAAGVTGKIQFTPSAIFEQIDGTTSTLLLNDSSAANTSFVFANGDTIIGTSSGANCVIGNVADTNISYHEPRFYNSVPDNTTISSKLLAKKSGASGNTTFTRIKSNDRNYPSTPIKLMSKSNEIRDNSGNKSVKVRHILSSDTRHSSPMIDLQSQGMLLFENIINNDLTNEHVSEQGNASAKYVSRVITLKEGLDAEDIKVFVNAYKPANTDIKVYAKILNEVDDVEIRDRHWSELQRTQNNDAVSQKGNREDVIEYGFEFKDSLDKTLISNGSITFSTSSFTVTGAGTNFDGDFAVGDIIHVEEVVGSNTDYFASKITAIASDTSMTIADLPSFSESIGKGEYFKVNSDNLNTAFRDPGAPVAFQATYYNNDGEKFVGYNRLAIKIVMTADSTAHSPYIQDYRAIAVSL